MANLQGGDFNKFLVIKRDDIKNYLSKEDVRKLLILISRLRVFKNCNSGKKIENVYLVINTDESYADEVIEILKRNGHWG